MFDEYFDYLKKKNTCFNQVVYEWNIEKNQTAGRFISQSCKLSGIL